MNARALLTVGALAAGLVAYIGKVRPWHLRWGATDEEHSEQYWGDPQAARTPLWSTRAVTIAAPPGEVWPWIAQIGQDKAGCYSYTWLENLVGCHMPNVEAVVPEWQHPEVGDEVWLHPKAPPLHVTHLQPGRLLVLEDGWGFIVRPAGDGGTRFIVRGRGQLEPPRLPPILSTLYWRGVFEPAHFIMERKMLLKIKTLSERNHEERAGAVGEPEALFSPGP
jgi:hypothetical protein